MSRLSEWINRRSSGAVALLFAVLFGLFVAFVLPAQPRIATAPGVEATSPDLSFTYSAADLYRTADAYGASGRSAYVRQRATFDVVWPLVYVAFLATGTSWVYRRLGSGSRFWRRANLLPVAAGLLDLLENVCTSAVMIRYPEQTPVVATLAPLFSTAKWVALAAAFAVLVAGLLLLGWRWVTTLVARRHPG